MSTTTRGSRLPRGPRAPKLGPDETVLHRTGADLQNGWLSRHGELVITEDMILFRPTVLDTLLRAPRREIALDAITRMDRFPRLRGEMPAGGRRPRVLIHTEGCVYEFMVGDVDGWIDTMERVYQRRSHRGRPYAPTVVRQGHANVLLQD